MWHGRPPPSPPLPNYNPVCSYLCGMDAPPPSPPLPNYNPVCSYLCGIVASCFMIGEVTYTM